MFLIQSCELYILRYVIQQWSKATAFLLRETVSSETASMVSSVWEKTRFTRELVL